MDKLAYSVKEAAEELSLGKNTVYELIYQKKLAYVQVGRRMIIPRNVLEKFLRENLEIGTEARVV